MSDAFLGEIRMFPFNFAPMNWAHCDGQILPLFQYTALFSLLGTNFGGNGTSNFALPNLQGCCVVDVGQGPGLSPYGVGQSGGVANVALIQQQNPSHNHLLNVVNSVANSSSPAGNVFAKGDYDNNGAKGVVDLYTPTAATTTLNVSEIGPAGGNLPHNNLMPYLTLNFCIAMQGYYPPHS